MVPRGKAHHLAQGAEDGWSAKWGCRCSFTSLAPWLACCKPFSMKPHQAPGVVYSGLPPKLECGRGGGLVEAPKVGLKCEFCGDVLLCPGSWGPILGHTSFSLVKTQQTRFVGLKPYVVFCHVKRVLWTRFVYLCQVTQFFLLLVVQELLRGP